MPTLTLTHTVFVVAYTLEDDDEPRLKDDIGLDRVCGVYTSMEEAVADAMVKVTKEYFDGFLKTSVLNVGDPDEGVMLVWHSGHHVATIGIREFDVTLSL